MHLTNSATPSKTDSAYSLSQTWPHSQSGMSNWLPARQKSWCNINSVINKSTWPNPYPDLPLLAPPLEKIRVKGRQRERTAWVRDYTWPYSQLVSGTQTLVFLFLYARGKNEGLGDRLHKTCVQEKNLNTSTTPTLRVCACVFLAIIAPIFSGGTILCELFIMEDSCAACQTPTAGKKRRLLRGDVKVSSLFQELVPANVKPTKYLCRLVFPPRV